MYTLARQVTDDGQMSGILDDISKVVGKIGGIAGTVGGIADAIKRGGTITIGPPGQPGVSLDTRDPQFLAKLRQVLAAYGSSSEPPTATQAASGMPSWAIPAAIGGGLLLLLVMRR